MTYTQERHFCSGCGEDFDSEETAEICELEHEVQDLVQKVSRVNGDVRDVYQDVAEWLELTLDASQMHFGSANCPSCDELVHETWEQCPECYTMLEDEEMGHQLMCGNCHSKHLNVYNKKGVSAGFGFSCATCGDHVAHAYGTVKIRNTGGEWDDE